MTALSGDRVDTLRPTAWVPIGVAASQQIYDGALTMVNSSGYLLPAADTASCTFAGAANQNVLGGATDGLVNCNVVPPGQSGPLALYCANVTAAYCGQLAYAVDDQTVALTGGVINHVLVGKIIGILTTGTAGMVIVDPSIRVA